MEGTHVEPAQIDADLALLSKYTDCVRTYSIENGLDTVPEIAQRHGVKVLQGLWLSSDAEKNRRQIATVIALGKKFPETIRAIIVGNEVLLRGEMSATDLMAIIREVKAQVPEPVSYADVWEYWLRNPRRGQRRRFRHHPHSAVLGGFPAAGVACGRACRRHPQTCRRGDPEQGDRHRRGRLAERRPHARRRAALAVESGARDRRDAGACAARKFPGQHYRGIRPALETLARRFGRRSLGHFRSQDGSAEIRSCRRRGIRPPPLADAGFGRHSARGVDVRRRVLRRRGKTGAALFVVEDCGARVASGRHVRLDDRDRSGGEFYVRAAGCARSRSRQLPRARRSCARWLAPRGGRCRHSRRCLAAGTNAAMR